MLVLAIGVTLLILAALRGLLWIERLLSGKTRSARMADRRP
jgi:hypothetical protein